MVKMLRSSPLRGVPTPCGALTKQKEIGKELGSGAVNTSETVRIPPCQSKEDYMSAIVDLSSVEGFPFLKSVTAPRTHMAFSRDHGPGQKSAVGKDFDLEFHSLHVHLHSAFACSLIDSLTGHNNTA